MPLPRFTVEAEAVAADAVGVKDAVASIAASTAEK